MEQSHKLSAQLSPNCVHVRYSTTELSIIPLIVRETDILVAVFVNDANVHNEFNQWLTRGGHCVGSHPITIEEEPHLSEVNNSNTIKWLNQWCFFEPLIVIQLTNKCLLLSEPKVSLPLQQNSTIGKTICIDTLRNYFPSIFVTNGIFLWSFAKTMLY